MKKFFKIGLICLSLSLLVISSGFGISNVYAVSHEPMVCMEYNPNGTCKSGMRLEDWQRETDRQYNQQVILTLATIIIVPAIIIIFIAVIVSSIKKSQKNKRKINQEKVEKQLEFEKKQYEIKQQQEKEIKELKEKVERLEEKKKDD
jgi:competence protein ComGC